MEREVIVVGAGPAGATAAISLSQQGHDVLLLDRQQFPRDKPCGDGIPVGVTEILYDLGLQETFEQGDFYPVDKLRLVSPGGYSFDVPLQGGERDTKAHIIPRQQFDTLLQQHALRTGAEFCQAQVQQPLIEEGQVKGVKARIDGILQDIKAKVVIAADGATSAIARALRPDKQQDSHRAIALRAYIDGIELLPNQVEFYLYKNILPGYAWIFPLGSRRANIGLGMRLDKFRQKNYKLEELLQVFMTIPTIKNRLCAGSKLHDVMTWQLNFGSQKNIQRVYDGAVLVGDAGGFIDPLSGGGIEQAMVSAQFAAESVHHALVEGDFTRRILNTYEQRCHDQLWAGLRRSYFIQRWLLLFPSLVDWFVKHARNNSQLVQAFITKL